MKNLFMIPAAGAAVLIGAALFISSPAVLTIILCILGLIAAGLAVFLAKQAGQHDGEALIKVIEALSNNTEVAIPTNVGSRTRQAFLAIHNMFEEHGLALQSAQTMAEEVEEYKKRMEEGLANEKRSQEEQTNFRYALRYATHKTQRVYNSMSEEIHHLSQMVGDIGHSMEMQKFSMQQTSVAMQQISGSIDGVAESVATASDNAQTSRSKAKKVQSEIHESTEIMESVKEAFTELKDDMLLLGRQSDDINSIIGVISEVAEQTTRLALNVTIEAARMGDAGSGLTSVAEDVRKLAEQTTKATLEVGGVVRAIQASAKQNIRSMDSVTRSLAKSSNQLNRAESTMDEVAKGIINAASEMKRISGDINAQTENCRHTNEAIQNMHAVIRTSAKHMIEFTGRLVSIASSVEELEISTGMLGGLREDESEQRSRIVKWSPALATNIDLIDYQHKMLCLYINTLYRATVRDAGTKVIAEIVDFLKVYTVTHFATEERYFDQIEYPDAASHRQIHGKFVEKVAQVQKDLFAGKITVGDDLLNFLKDWLVNHIRVTDHEYASFLKGYLATAKEEEEPSVAVAS